MRPTHSPAISDRAGTPPGWCSGSWPPSAAPGCHHEAEIEFPPIQAPDRAADPAAGPEDRPGRRAAQLHRELRAHVDLSQADRLHPEVDRGHRRQGEESRRARHALRPELVEELGTKKAAVVLDRERIALAKEVVEVAKADVEAAEARLKEAEAILEQVRGRGRPLGHGGQAARAPGRPGRGQFRRPLRVDQSAQVEHRGARQGEGDDQEGEGGTARRPGQARQGPGGRQGRRSRP